MAHYTTSVRSYLETLAGYEHEQDFDKIDEIISASRAKVFTKDYDIFDGSYKSVIESKILYHYYMREIGAETVGLWKFYMNRTMTEIMPYYNKLYESARLEYNPLYDVDYTREGNKEGTEDATRTGNTTGKTTLDSTQNMTGTDDRTSKDSGTVTDAGTSGNIRNRTDNTTSGEDVITADNNKDRYSDTPQNGLSAVENNQYLTSYRNVTNDSTRNVSASSGETERVEDAGTSGNVRTLATTHTDDINTTETIKKSEETNTTGNSKDVADVDTTEKWLERIHGKNGGLTYQEMILKYRETLINIDKMIIDEFSDCFFGLV